MASISEQAHRALPGRAFLVREALHQGYGRGALAHPRWHRPFSGVRTGAPPASTLSGRALDYVPRLRPGDRFSHATALALLGCPIRVTPGAPVDVSSPAARGRVACDGVVGHRHTAEAPQYPCVVPEQDEWVPVASPLHAVLQAASTLPFRELVVALDHLLRRDPQRYDPQLRVLPKQLRRAAETAAGRGVVRFRAAAALARVGADSRMETLMRLAGARAGMPELDLQFEVRDRAGVWIGRFDGADRASRSLFEFDGEQHLLTLGQRKRDARKHQGARDAGWRILVFYREELTGDLLPAGRSMLEFSGRVAHRVPAGLARLLDETAAGASESAIPIRRRLDRG